MDVVRQLHQTTEQIGEKGVIEMMCVMREEMSCSFVQASEFVF